MEQHYKRYKGTQKDFYRFMVTELEDFFPRISFEDPLKKYEDQLNNMALYPTQSDSISIKGQIVRNSAQETRYRPNFNVTAYWKQFSSTFTQNLVKFLGLKDMISLIYTCKYFKEILDQESTWKMLQLRDFSTENLTHLTKDIKSQFSMKNYYKFLYLGLVSGIPHHTGYFTTYGSPDVAELSRAMVDFLCPKTEPIKEYLGETFTRNLCKTSDVKLSWLRETKEICLWNANSSVEFRKPETGNELVEQVQKFYPCFIKKYSLTDENEEIVGVFFLEDRYLVVKILRRDEEKMIFRILDLEEEFHSIAKGLDSMIPFDYIFTLDKENKIERKADDEFEVEFSIHQEGEFDMKVHLLENHKAVFFTKYSEKPQMIFWDLKEKKQIGSTISLELKKPLHEIISSKKPEGDKLKIFILDEGMNIYIGNLLKEEGFILNQSKTILIPEELNPKEEDEAEKQEEIDKIEKERELQTKLSLTFGKKTRTRYYAQDGWRLYVMSYPVKDIQEDNHKREAKTRRYHDEIFERTCEGIKKKEEWLVVHKANRFYFVNLDEEKMYEFASDIEDIGKLVAGNWTIYEDNLLITDPLNVSYYKLNFEDKTIKKRLPPRQTKRFEVEKVVKQWIVMDACFTVLIFTHNHHLGSATKVTVVVTSTQEFLYNKDKDFNAFSYKIQAQGFLDSACDQWENKPREVDVNVKFENSKVFVSSKKAGFFFDMNLSSQPYNNVYLNGWVPKHAITTIAFLEPLIAEATPEEQEEEEKPKVKFVNNMKLKGNPNTANAKEKSNGWNKNGKSQAKKEEHREEKMMKGKGDKYHKNVRQGQRSDKIN